MTKIKKGGLIAALCSMVAVSGGLVTMNQLQSPSTVIHQDYEAVTEKKDYTVMVYMIGSDLEADAYDAVGAGSTDLQEMMQVMTGEQADIINQRTNLVIEVGGSYQWEMEPLSDLQNARFCIDDNGINHLTELPEVNMGESEALSDFINYGVETYPAENYVLLFWNHGNGPVEGYGYDVLHEGDGITLSEMKKGIENSDLAESRLEVVGFDACLMSSIETVGVMSDFADYMIASAELEPQDGWDYSLLKMFADPDFTGEELGQHMLDSYLDSYDEKDCQVTLACMDLHAYEEVRNDLNAYMKHLEASNQEEVFQRVSQCRKQVQGFGSNNSPMDICDLVDMEQLLRTLSEEAWMASGLEESFDKLICDTVAKGYGQEPCGVSIYLPSGTDAALEDSIRKYKKSGFEETYLEFTTQYAAYLLNGEELNLELGIRDYGEEEGKITAELSPLLLPDVAAVYFLTAKPLTGIEHCSYILSTDSDLTIQASGQIEAYVDETYVALKGEVLCLIEQYNSQERTEYLSPILYNDELCMMKICFSDENMDGEIVSIVPVSEEKLASKKEYQLEIGTRIVPLYPLFTDENTDMETLSGRTDIYENQYYIGSELIMEQEWDMLLETLDIDVKEYSFGFMIQDIRQQFQYTELLQLS